jgi:hypothetical protein
LLLFLFLSFFLFSFCCSSFSLFRISNAGENGFQVCFCFS